MKKGLFLRAFFTYDHNQKKLRELQNQKEERRGHSCREKHRVVFKKRV
jgi:hypothetical protein